MIFHQHCLKFLGMRFGYLQTKVGLVTLLLEYEVSLSSKTRLPIQYNSITNTLSTKSGIWLKIHHREKNKT